jgi:hypothetical protein
MLMLHLYICTLCLRVHIHVGINILVRLRYADVMQTCVLAQENPVEWFLISDDSINTCESSSLLMNSSTLDKHKSTFANHFCNNICVILLLDLDLWIVYIDAGLLYLLTILVAKVFCARKN